MKNKRYIRGTHSASSTKKDSIFNFSDMTIYISLITALGYKWFETKSVLR